MTDRVNKKIPLTAVMGHLYGYIYCMLVSNMLVDMPLFGGALYLCGRAVAVSVSIFGKKNRQYLPSYSRGWVILLMVVLLGISGLLTGLYPADFESDRVWIMFGMVVLCLCADDVALRMRRLTESSRRLTGRTMGFSILMQSLLIGAAALVLIVNLGWKDGWPLTAAFALMAVGKAFFFQLPYDMQRIVPESSGKAGTDIHGIRAYHSMEWVSLLLVMAVELTIAVLYALLATNLDWLFPAIVVAVLCTLLPAMAGYLLLRRMERSGRKDPTWLLLIGLILWLGGIFLCSHMLQGGQLSYTRVYAYLAVCTVGGTLSLTGLRRIEEVMPDALNVTGNPIPPDYWKMRYANWELARLLGDVLALIALCIICFISGKDLPQNAEDLAARFRPVMMIPVSLVLIGALICAIRFPLGSRFLARLKKFLKLQEAGEENPALQRQLEHVVKEKYRQPYLTRILIFILRRLYKHTLINADRIVTDDRNPLVFLCNHGEINGPIVCNFMMPVPIRTWTISMMMYDRKEVSAYLYENTFSKITGIPVFLRKALANLVAWLSVCVMNQLEAIPVYRDSPLKLRETIRISIDALEAGDNLLIFPEAQEENVKYKLQGIGKISPGFLMLAEAYWKKTHKKMRIMPMYADQKKRTLSFGHMLQYEPENGFREEQERIVAEAERQILEMAGIPAEGAQP